MVVLRFLTGLGLGAGMPNATTLLSEYTPERHKSLLVTSMFCGFNLGMAGGGFISAKLIPMYGWHSLLLIGGVLPLLLTLILVVWLPESARFLVVRNRSIELIRKPRHPLRRGWSPWPQASASPSRRPRRATCSPSSFPGLTAPAPCCCGSPILWAW